MKFPLPSSLILALTLTGCAASIAERDEPRSDSPSPTLAQPLDTETPGLKRQIKGTLVVAEPVGGIASFDLPTLSRTEIRPKDVGLTAIHGLSMPDVQDSVVFVTETKKLLSREFVVNLAHAGTADREIYRGPGDPLWDHPISDIAYDRSGARIAFVSQLKENIGKRFTPLISGRLQVLELAQRSTHDLGIEALGQRPAWFPDGRRLAYTANRRASSDTPATAQDPVVRVLHVDTGEDSLIAAGHSPIVSTDGKTVLLLRGKRFELFVVDVSTGRERRIPRVHGLGVPIALIDSRYLIYRGATTPGAASGVTENNSPLVGEKPMMAIKLLDIQTKQFTTIVPLIDPRTHISAWGVSIPADLPVE